MRCCLIFAGLLGIPALATAADPSPEAVEHFEKHVRPILAEHCFKCHSAEGPKPKGGLRIDGRGHLLKGGDNGPALVPGEPGKSRLIAAIKYEDKDLQMPPKGKLPAAAIATLERWVRDRAPWPNDTSTVQGPGEFDLKKRVQEHWSWKPISPGDPGKAANSPWVQDRLDAFILAKLEAKNLKPAPVAEPLVWLRRVTFAITGFPPTRAECEAFLRDDPGQRQAKVVDRLLASPHYGERWARHWLDLVRYAESRGHEFDPDIPNAYQYRDYVVRAFNADVPYNQFVREHLAGDAIPTPRIAADGTNESLIGSGFWHLGEEVHSPVDIRQDQADRLDNRIDVLSKAFLGLTVACARCHDHKFDAISTKDYYALFGLLEGSSYRLARPDGWTANRDAAQGLARLRRSQSDLLAAKSRVIPTAPKANDAVSQWLKNAIPMLDFSGTPADWLPDDVSFGTSFTPAGTLRLRTGNGQPTALLEDRSAAVFDRFWERLTIAPGSSKDVHALGRMVRPGFSIRTRTLPLQKKNLYYLVRGAGMAYAAVNGHTVIAGPLHGSLVNAFPNSESYRWVPHHLAGYVGQRVHVEFTADPKTEFAVAMVVQADEPPPGIPEAGFRLETPPPAPVLEELAREEAAELKKLAEKVVWSSKVVLALWDAPGLDSRVFIRGNPRTEGELVPRRSLEALAGAKALTHTTGSGRRELAEQWVNPQGNPYISRVIVNRVWHHVFGRGLVATPDNLGVLGEVPTHPELLDTLAAEFTAQGWSIKKLIRRLVLSSTFAMSSSADSQTGVVDPTNSLWHKYPLRRLDGEAIRDAILSASGRLDPKLGGPGVPIHLTPFLDGRGRPGSGPLDGNGRRSLYLAQRRNFLSPFLVAFDTPIPFSTVGRRQISNVPAQALILLNDPFVHLQCEVWAKKLLAQSIPRNERIRELYWTAFARPATETEISACSDFLKDREADPKAWADLVHSIINVKEFVFLK